MLVAPALAGGELFDRAREVVYSPIVGRSLVEATVKRLVSMVSVGLVGVGELLPSEPDLACRLGVSPATLREALAVLRGAGLLETKRGRGGGSVVVREVVPPAAEEARRRLAALSFDEVRDLGEYLTAIAGRAAALAAERATPVELGVLRSLVEAMGGCGDVAAFARLDARLHIGIASSARSSRLTASETGVQAELGEFASLLAVPSSRVRLVNGQHARIVDAVCARDATAASEEAERHAQAVASLLVETRSEVTDLESQHSQGAFAGLKPYGTELGSVTLEFPYDPIKRLGARTGQRP
jgi:GntR family transcriptional regulator, transcriptional repressor for pyruvate dehydrogenase complex